MPWSGPHKFSAMIYVGTSYFGAFEFPAPRAETPDGSLGYYNLGYAYFCRHCGEVWGRIVVTDHHGKQCPFQVISVPCEQHDGNWWCKGGSLLEIQAADLLDYFPPAAVTRELELYMKHYEKELV